MNKIYIIIILTTIISCTTRPVVKKSVDNSQKITTIAFGSCAHEYEDVPAFNAIVANQPDIFVWLGDMIYGDTEDMAILKKKYNQLKSKPEYQNLIKSVPVIGVWDDHDYGVNDGNKYYAKKDESKLIALDFLDVPNSDPRYGHEGLYSSYTLDSNNKRIKIILLDTRYFQDSLTKDNVTKHRYLPNKNGDVLGEEQWQWLESELINDDETDMYILGSSYQFIAKDHYYEKWANFPMARNRMIKLLNSVVETPLIIISGDRHIAEISKMNITYIPYPLIDFTASGLTHTWKGHWNEPNEFRVGELIAKKNYGLLKIKWEGENPTVVFEVRGVNGESYLEYSQTYDTNK